MPALPEIQTHTVNEIYARYERERFEWDSIGIPASNIGECDRAIWYAFRWASPPNPIPGQRLRRFDTGNCEEVRLLADLKAAGFLIQATDPATGKQRRVSMLAGHLRGKLDAKAFDLPEVPGEWCVVECKAVAERTFKELKKKKVREAKPKHFTQVQLYLEAEGLTSALYLATNTNNDEIYSELVPHDAEFCAAVVARCRRIVTASRAPSRISGDATKWPCVLCEFNALCHGEVSFARVNCRTCISSAPLLTDDALWRCEHRNRELSTEEQHAGCPSHLYLPDLVAGSQVDANPSLRTVTYRMAGGETWVDGVASRQESEVEGRAAE